MQASTVPGMLAHGEWHVNLFSGEAVDASRKCYGTFTYELHSASVPRTRCHFPWTARDSIVPPLEFVVSMSIEFALQAWTILVRLLWDIQSTPS